MRTAVLAACTLAALAVCVEVAPPTSAEPIEDGDSCPRLICGNTPYLGLVPFWDLDASGVEYSTNGLRISGAVNAGVPQRTEVIGFEWKRWPIGSTGPSASIGNTVITISDRNNTARFEVSAVPGPGVPYYEGGNIDGTLVPTYRISYVEIVGGKRRPPRGVCGPDPISPTLVREAIVFRGDRYDATTGTLTTTGSAVGSWFNVACKDDALWKLALMRHVEAAQAVEFRASPDHRRALLRSIRADYCGDGTPLTELGTAIDWINLGGWLLQDTDGSIEAMWGATGAKCLGETRLPGIQVPCSRPPPCAGFAWWQDGVSVVTLVPEEM